MAPGGWEVAIANFAELSAAERAALPRVAFVTSLDDALRQSEESPDVTFVTREADLVRGPLLRLAGPPARSTGTFAIRREQSEISERMEAARRAIAAIEAARAELVARREEAEHTLSGARDEEQRAQADLSATAARLEERRTAARRLSREADTTAAERALAREADALTVRRKAFEDEENRWERSELETRERAESLAGALPEARSNATSAAEELAHRRTEAEVAAERRRSLESAVAALEESQRLFERRARAANEEIEQISTRALELAREEQQTRERREGNVVSRDARAAELEVASRAWDEAFRATETGEETAKNARILLDSAREGRFEAEVTATRSASDLEHLVAQTREEFGTDPAELEPPADRSEEALAKLETEASELAASIEKLGPVNLLAWEEHRTETERLTFLTTQRDDLVRSVAELQDSIRKINATSAERFSHAFTEINANFTETFTRLFRGGTAEMRLLDESDPLESGVEIIAQPPGKRNQSILLLSGGEKALTAIALLMAIFRYRPSPFCILDEVDAPLDEANIDRFTQPPARNDRRHAVHRDHPQQAHDGDRGRDVRRHHGRARLFEGGVGPIRLITPGHGTRNRIGKTDRFIRKMRRLLISILALIVLCSVSPAEERSGSPIRAKHEEPGGAYTGDLAYDADAVARLAAYGPGSLRERPGSRHLRVRRGRPGELRRADRPASRRALGQQPVGLRGLRRPARVRRNGVNTGTAVVEVTDPAHPRVVG